MQRLKRYLRLGYLNRSATPTRRLVTSHVAKFDSKDWKLSETFVGDSAATCHIIVPLCARPRSGRAREASAPEVAPSCRPGNSMPISSPHTCDTGEEQNDQSN